MSPNFSLQDRKARALPRTLVMALPPLHVSCGAKLLATSSGLSPTQVSCLLFTSSRFPPQIRQTCPSSRYQSPTRMPPFGACSTLHMQDTISPPSVSSSERFRRTLPDRVEVELGFPSLVRLLRRKPCGRHWGKETKIVWSGLYCAPHSISSSMSFHLIGQLFHLTDGVVATRF